MRALKFLLLSALFLFVMGMAMFGVVFGIGMAIVGILLGIVKVALMVIIPVAIVLWLVRRATASDRVYH